MDRTKTLLAASIALAGAFSCVAGCWRYHEGHPNGPQVDAEAAGRAAFAEYDTNGDGKIAGAELDRCPGVRAAIAQIDPSGKREATSTTIAARIQTWQKSRLGRMSVSCRVTRNGHPLPDAEVKFVPEKLLGPIVPTASGTTDKDGVAIMSCSRSGQGPPGAAPGFYRIEITKRGVNVPATYNTATVLGLEIAMDADWITKCGAKPIEFDLRY
jgi:hypothetical protein